MYIIDSNILIDAKNTYYPFGIVPGFWSWVKVQAEERKCFSIIQVKRELQKQDDQLKHWVELLPDSFWLRDSTASNVELANLTNWVQTRNYKPTAVQTFYRSADYRLAAQAKATGFTLVTSEIADAKRMNEIKLPDACVGISGQVIGPFRWIQTEATRFDGFDHS